MHFSAAASALSLQPTPPSLSLSHQSQTTSFSLPKSINQSQKSTLSITLLTVSSSKRNPHSFLNFHSPQHPIKILQSKNRKKKKKQPQKTGGKRVKRGKKLRRENLKPPPPDSCSLSFLLLPLYQTLKFLPAKV